MYFNIIYVKKVIWKFRQDHVFYIPLSIINLKVIAIEENLIAEVNEKNEADIHWWTG